MRLVRAVIAAGLCAVALAGCGGALIGAAADAGLRAAQHTSFGRKHATLIQTAYCGVHLWRLEADVRHHHLGWAALQAYLSAHHCGKVARSAVGL